jgi:SagB-type dehydrogenase family enzyme
MSKEDTGQPVKLPTPRTRGTRSLEEVLEERRSIREFAPEPLTWERIGQLMWSAQGITNAEGLRTTPSAGALYPLELYVATGDGVFHYRPKPHDMVRTLEADVRNALRQASLDQPCMAAPCVVAMAAVVERIAAKYPEVADICTKLEVGHAAQNLLLQVTALGLVAVPVAAFDPPRLRTILRLPPDQEVMYLIPVGHPRK